ncbi:hypothetical protein ACEF96_003143 [Salmonella enterica]|nr:hypothetical protein [Salmonella enterica]
MPIENAAYINELNPDWPVGSSDFVSQGDDQLRMLKKVLQNTLPNANEPITGTPTQINNITLNTPWQDNSATPGALSNFNLNDPTKTDGTLAAIAVGTPTVEQANDNPDLALTFRLFQELQYPVGGPPYINLTDSRNPADILGFGTWEPVVGLIAGVGAATDGNGYTQNYSAGYQSGRWRVGNEQIVSQQLDVTLTMDPVDDHTHPEATIKSYWGDSNHTATVPGDGEGSTGPAGGHTPTGTGSVTIGSGSTTDGDPFVNPYYGAYIWRRTA